jgi:hypothetical protein
MIAHMPIEGQEYTKDHIVVVDENGTFGLTTDARLAIFRDEDQLWHIVPEDVLAAFQQTPWPA